MYCSACVLVGSAQGRDWVEAPWYRAHWPNRSGVTPAHMGACGCVFGSCLKAAAPTLPQLPCLQILHRLPHMKPGDLKAMDLQEDGYYMTVRQPQHAQRPFCC